MNSNMVQKHEENANAEHDNKLWPRVSFRPRVDVLETDEELKLYLDMPGVKSSDVNLRFEKGELAVLGRVSPRQSETEFALCEYGVGDFQRSFTIHQEIEADKISAELKSGVLTVHLPKAEKYKPRKIVVKGD